MIVSIEGLPPLHKFVHNAMNSFFEVWIPGDDPRYARHAAQEIFAEIDRLEQNLSRFIENSEIARINAMAGCQMVKVGPHTMECLRVAYNVSQVTGGAFDPTVGALMSVWKPGGGPVREPAPGDLAAAAAVTGMRLLHLDEENWEAGLSVPGAMIDLGAIGKGYALDVAARILREWGITTALVHGGGSSICALGAPEGLDGWPVGMGYGAESAGDASARRALLRDMALSTSGLEVQGNHILDPRTGRPPVARSDRAWALNPSATVTDALSTAFMVMSAAEVEAVCRQFADVGAMLLASGQLHRFGALPAEI